MGAWGSARIQRRVKLGGTTEKSARKFISRRRIFCRAAHFFLRSARPVSAFSLFCARDPPRLGASSLGFEYSTPALIVVSRKGGTLHMPQGPR